MLAQFLAQGHIVEVLGAHLQKRSAQESQIGEKTLRQVFKAESQIQIEYGAGGQIVVEQGNVSQTNLLGGKP